MAAPEDRYFSYERLEVYRVARELSRRIHEIIAHMPESAAPLKRQWMRACNGMTSNIAEGAQETKPAEKARLYRIARRETGEVNSCTGNALDARYVRSAIARELTIQANRVSAMLYGMIKRFS